MEQLENTETLLDNTELLLENVSNHSFLKKLSKNSEQQKRH